PTLWNNTFMLDLKKLKDDGYDVIGCKWYKNGIEQFITNTIDEFSYSAGPYATDQLESAPTYYSFRLITSNHGDLCSTIKLIDSDKMPPVPGDKIWAHPNPVMSGAPFTVEGVAKNDEVRVYNQSGICVHTAIATGETITLTLHVQAGVYLVRVNEKQVKVVIIR
ncbi:MAG: T9SS type A sorting domain-containing protein, partial [Bacteroidales bacterium]|nr:T9SS type A sorting domain-containing protein [Bacteroidales bacterium]